MKDTLKKEARGYFEANLLDGDKMTDYGRTLIVINKNFIKVFNEIIDRTIDRVRKEERERIKETIKESREKLADLEHQQWVHWTDYMLKNLTSENQERWMRQIETNYKALSEKEKDSDREWADKSIKEILKTIKL
ncbi:MAG: hypothetical protein U9R08_02770 [Nanoarchaeota archaeon]|nr:hypothetical protein [Nanoarchaeota archaeon]